MNVVRRLCLVYHLSQHQESKKQMVPKFDLSASRDPEHSGALPSAQDAAIDRVIENEEMINFFMVDEESGAMLSISLEFMKGRKANLGMVWREKVRRHNRPKNSYTFISRGDANDTYLDIFFRQMVRYTFCPKLSYQT